MSLLDDVSIVVTPNGYKAGELYAVVPVPTEGSEEVVNGDFATDSNWTKETGWTISGGTANYSGGTSNRNIRQAIGITNGKTYKIQYQVTAITSGEVACRFGGMSGVDEITATTTGTYVGYISANSSVNGELLFEDNDNSFVGSIDNVSVKEYTSADMDVTRATAATRVDENGLVNYAEVLGGEEVTCGDFSCAVPLDSWTVGSKWSIGVSGARLESSTSAASSLVQSNVFEIGKIYKVTLDAVVISGKAKLEGSGGSAQFLIEETKTYTEYFVASKEDFYLNRVSSVSDIYIDNISVKEVTRDNVPRIDYTGGGCPHILAEPQRTNVIPYSEDFSQWILNSVTLTANATTSPSGSLDATLVDLSATTDSRLVNNVGVVSSTQYTFSIYLKKHESDSDGTFPLAYYDGSNYIKTYVNLTDVWQRFDLTFMNPSGGIFGYGLSRKGTTSDETLTRCYAWAGQLEQASYPTSYIPTNGEAGGVTRNQDIFTRDGIGSLIGSEGVLFVEMAALSDDGTNRGISLNDGTATNRLLLYFSAASNQIAVISTGFAGSIIYTLPDETSFNKIAVRYKANDITLWVDGESRGTPITSATIPTFTALKFDSGSLSSPFFGKVKQLQVYDTSLSDEQLLQLTGESGTDFYESYAEMASALTYTIQ